MIIGISDDSEREDVVMATNLTKQRRAVLDVVKASSDHPTAADVMDRLRIKDYKFAYATVYNSLRYLVEQGLITELRITDSVSRYDGFTEEHQHAVCDVCGKVTEVMTRINDSFVTAAQQETGYTFGRTELVLHGVCPDCKQNQRKL